MSDGFFVNYKAKNLISKNVLPVSMSVTARLDISKLYADLSIR